MKHPGKKKLLPSDPSQASNKLLQHPAALCNMVKRIAIDAGEILLKYYDGIEDMEVDVKADDSPVTLADREAEGFIQMSLEQILPDIPIVGEEAVALGKAPKMTQEQGYFWLLDPLDGTKEFIGGGQDFTVNIALIYKGEPVLGVVFAPVRGELYAGYGEGTATKTMVDNDIEKPISVRGYPAEGLTVVASKRHGDADKLDKFLESFKTNKLVKYGSSLKICKIAAAKADMYPRFGPTCEWDTAAAHAVLRSAGGVLTDEKGKELTYGGENPKWLNPEFIACSFPWHDYLAE
ncbi:MAG: 3'(2'),5'-bisphosphate nucleotidase CysQ [Micavibrio sp.]|nr:3'(2'),5'-bisphosphate nucleotidase CysQ [Micavibrio sp.]